MAFKLFSAIFNGQICVSVYTKPIFRILRNFAAMYSKYKNQPFYF